MPSNYSRLWHSPSKMISRRCIYVLLVLLALPLLLGAKHKKPSPREMREIVKKEPVIYRKGFLKVVSPDKVSVEQAKKAAKVALEAWNFDLKQMEWSRSVKMHRPITLRLVSKETMKKEFGYVTRAQTYGNTGIILMDKAFVDAPRGPGPTLAHELGHLQMFRALGKHKTPPLYFVEGHGMIMNRLYADHLRISSPTDWKPQVKIVMTTSPKETKIIFTDNNYSKGDKRKVDKMYSLAVYFVEYMRTRVNGKGIPDMVPKMARVFELEGRGRTYGQAFKQVYGVSVNNVVSQIVELFKRTESNPAERLRGTRFEAAAKAVAEKSRKKGGAKSN